MLLLRFFGAGPGAIGRFGLPRGGPLAVRTGDRIVSERHDPIKGRGTSDNPANRFHETHREAFDDGWDSTLAEPSRPQTSLLLDSSRSVIVYNQSPDVPFDRSINPYRGCEHGCVYCFARPTHAYLDCSPGLDFETRIFYKPQAAQLLSQELAKPGYRCQPIALGINTDAYQPAERQLKITRGVLEVLREYRHPVGIVTKSAMVERDLDLLVEMAERQLVHIMVSVTTLDAKLAHLMEPRAAAPRRRLETIRRLRDAGIPTGVLLAPVIPVLNDAEIENILETVHEAGALSAGYVMLRLPHEVKDLFTQWLQQHYPLKAEHVMNRIRDIRGGRENDSRFGSRMRGSGIYADLISKRFASTSARLGFQGMPAFDCNGFRVPPRSRDQLVLF
jgi:DNA repair photolyase